jgi:hypothetical protein
LRLYPRLSNVFTDNAKVLAFKLSGLTAATNAYDFLDTNKKKML